MLTDYERRPEGCTPLGCGFTFLVVGILIALVGYFWHFPSVTATTGIIVESQPRLAGSSARHITYEYEASGIRHRGQRVFRYPSQFAGTYEVGSSFPVYFVTAHPEQSYAPNRPLSTRIIVMGIFLAVASSGVIFLAGRR